MRGVFLVRTSFRRCQTSSLGRALSSSEQSFLKENGYAVLRNYISRDHCSRLEERMWKMLDEFDPSTTSSVFRTHRTEDELTDQYFLESGDKVRFFWEEDAFGPDGHMQHPKRDCVNKVGHALHLEDPLFGEYVFKHLRPAIESAGFGTPIPLQTMYICKSQRTGGEVGPHQDSTFLYTNPLSVHGFWLSVHSANQANGCLWVLPGSHRLPLYQQFVRRPTNPVSLELIPAQMPKGAVLPTDGGVPVETEIGDMVVLHGQLVHWSNANKSEQSRHSFMTHVVDGECEYVKENWLQYPDAKPFPRFEQYA